MSITNFEKIPNPCLISTSTIPTDVMKPVKKSRQNIPVELLKYQRLNRSVWYYSPEKQPTTPTGEPSVVLLAGWMSATPRHISKYTSGYSALYPHARIIAITTTHWDIIPVDFVSGGVGRIQPILDILYGLQPHEKVLLHFMSNGGVMTSVFIAKTFQQHTGRKLPISGIVMDSSPGKATWKASVRAFSQVIPKNKAGELFGYFVIYLLFGIYCGIFILFNIPDGVAQGRVALNDPEIFDIRIPRVYIFSESDRIVDFTDVEEHAREAQEVGYKVQCEKFTESGHAGHLLVNAQRYWSAVQSMWAQVECRQISV